MSELKPTFTDVKQRKVVAKIVEEVGFEYLSIETINADGESTSQILELNVYDAKRLSLLLHCPPRSVGGFLLSRLSTTSRWDRAAPPILGATL